VLHSFSPTTRETETREGIPLTLVGDVGLKGVGACLNVWLSTLSVRQRGQCGRCGERPMQSEQIKTVENTTHAYSTKKV
jgi:hypothetical protein